MYNIGIYTERNMSAEPPNFNARTTKINCPDSDVSYMHLYTTAR